MKKQLPNRFHNVDLKTNEEYKNGKKPDKCWWNSLDKNKKYGNNLDNLFAWKHRMTYHGGHCKKYKIIDETFFT